MSRKKLLSFFTVAVFIIAISIVSYFSESPFASGNGGASGDEGVEDIGADEREESNHSVENKVENNLNGGEADVTNTIDNNLNGGAHNSIENNVTNNIEVNIDMNVTNNIENHVKGNDSNGNGKNGQQEENGDTNQKREGSESNGNEPIWGVDSASVTTNELLACVKDQFGSPEIWGRYLGDKEGVSYGLTSDEVELLHSNEIKILAIWNHFTNATGFENGKNEAEQAIEMAKELGIPTGVALFVNIEPIYEVDAEFIKGWFETLNESEYEVGIYGIFDSDKALTHAYEQAIAESTELAEETYLWTAAPNVGITAETDAPEFNPEVPDNALIGGWQYGIDAEACNIDTNLFHPDVVEVLW